MGGRRRNKSQRNAAPAAVHVIPDELLESFFLRLPSPLHLVRAACTCKRWRHVVGQYRVDEREHRRNRPRPPGSNPVFVPCSPPLPSADTVHMRHFSLDFLPDNGGGFWELADSRGGLLLLLSDHKRTYGYASQFDFPDLVVCEPCTRRCRVIPPSAWFHGCRCFGAFLLDGDADETGSCISLSNFRILSALYRDGIARACVFSSGSSDWTAGRTTAGCRMPRLPEYDFMYFEGSSRRSVSWTIGNWNVLVLNKDTAEFSSSSLDLDVIKLKSFYDKDKYHGPAYMYQLPWPPTIRACLPE